MSYLDKLQKAKVGDTVYIKSGFFEPFKHKILSIENNIATLNCDGNNNLPWKFSIETSDAVTPPFEYWISMDKN